jgi:rSAM/selenodomain-associated transferase 2
MTSTQKKISNISIIVPTLNEAANLPALKPAAAIVRELIVVDGGSTDGTVDTARDLGFQILEETGPGGRGMQLNTGAANASAPILLFLHADTLLPPDFPDAVVTCLENPDTTLGAFRLKVDNGGLLLNFIVMCANLRSKFLHLPYGDQSLFMRKHDFMEFGGFPEVPIMEDFMLVKQAKKHGRIQTLPQPVTTSARRWQRLGPIRTTYINQLVILGYYLGVTPQKLASFYREK